MNCVILQPSFIPWRGYFDQIRRADTFVFYDDVQFDKHGWRNRNRIKGPNGPFWLTIPVLARGAVSRHVLINEVKIDHTQPWRRKHLGSIAQSYRNAPFHAKCMPVLEEIYAHETDSLAEFTIAGTVRLARELGITHTKFLRSSELGIGGDKTQRLVNIVRHVGANHYISGPSASSYIEPDKFESAGIGLEYMAYDYPEYTQLFPPFDPQVSIVDLLFMKGDQAADCIFPRSH